MVFERKVLRKIYVAYFDAHDVDEQSRLHNDKFKIIFQRPGIISEIKKEDLGERDTLGGNMNY